MNDIQPYTLRISRLTVDKLGVKLYDKASAVVSELIANSYDADAENVTVRIPLGTVLGKREDGEIHDLGYRIEVADDGHGMTPDEAQNYFLRVGTDRRRRHADGARSRKKRRPVMGRKGIGKLAPFGICRRIEVISSGGERTESGFVTSHFIMPHERLATDSDDPVELDRGAFDRTFLPNSGTRVILTGFLNKRVPTTTVFLRQLGARFGLGAGDFNICVEDTRPSPPASHSVGDIELPIVESTRVDLSQRPVEDDVGRTMPVSGWMALAKNAYKNDELAGVRIYARGKIVAQTRDFEQPAGFTGEFTMRSYLVGEVHAEWLDEDHGEDLVRTDRQGILWESDQGRALKRWGADIIREIAARSRKPRRERVRSQFLSVSSFEKKAAARFQDPSVRQTALRLAKQIGAFAAEDELTDTEYVNDLAELILSVAPHQALVESFREFQTATSSGLAVELEQLVDLFAKTRVAEMASYAQIAAERVRAIEQLEAHIDAASKEAELQNLLQEAPWLIEPTWTVVTQNQSLRTFATAFSRFWKSKHNEEIHLLPRHPGKRPDFVTVLIGSALRVVEIKAVDHTFNDDDFTRLFRYTVAFEEFFNEHKQFSETFPRGWSIDLIADSHKLKVDLNASMFRTLVDKEQVRVWTWDDFLSRAKRGHTDFLDVRDTALMTADEV